MFNDRSDLDTAELDPVPLVVGVGLVGCLHPMLVLHAPQEVLAPQNLLLPVWASDNDPFAPIFPYGYLGPARSFGPHDGVN